MENNKKEIKVFINDEEYDCEIGEPLNANIGLEQIDGKWYVVHYPEGTEFWDDKDFFKR